MTLTISRSYQVRENADAAAAELRKAGFDKRDINVVAPAGAPDDEVIERIRQGGVAATQADAYAERIKRGETLVSILAAFGYAVLATDILEKHGPADAGIPEQGYEKTPPDPAAPLSSACGWRVLSNDPAPLSSALGLPLLLKRRQQRKPDSELADDPAPLSKAINMPVLKNRPAILSSRLGWRVLWDDPAPLSKRLGFPVLSKERKLPPARAGVRRLSDNPAPLSSRVGWKLLLNDPAPLSRLLGWRVLSDDPKKESAK
jgi:hypothetical protein